MKKDNEDYSIEDFMRDCENPLLRSPLADAYAGVLLFKLLKPVAKLFVKYTLPVALVGYLGAMGLKQVVDNTEFGRKLSRLEQKITDSEEYKTFSVAANSASKTR